LPESQQLIVLELAFVFQVYEIVSFGPSYPSVVHWIVWRKLALLETMMVLVVQTSLWMFQGALKYHKEYVMLSARRCQG
jgi:hypothetical protein